MTIRQNSKCLHSLIVVFKKIIKQTLNYITTMPFKSRHFRSAFFSEKDIFDK
uniref:Uncharacterized protein n=1 Tax=Anguilla anguilla TaxID=7936 RepID=A0A0E9PNW2_ANGAN